MRITQELYRPTTWPRAPGYELRQRASNPFLAASQEDEERVDLPLEIVPLVAELDLEDADAILGFVRRFGPMLAGDYRGLDVVGAKGLRVLPYLQRLRASLSPADVDGEFVAEFQLGAGQVKAVVTCLRELESSKRFDAGRLKRNWPKDAPWDAPQTAYAVRSYIVAGINAGLYANTPRLVPVDFDGRVGERRVLLGALSVASTTAEPESLFGVCAIELHNHVVAGREFLVCANERCWRPGGLFTMQESGGKTGVHRNDVVKFCCPSCARNQTQRNYRRREKSKGRNKR